MLQDIRDRSTGWIAKVIVGVIVVLLSFTGFEAIMSSTSNRNNAAKVNGEEITLDALAQEKSLQQRQLAQQFGSDFDINLLDDKLLNEMALKSLIGRKLLLQAAADAGFVGSTAAVDSFILQFPEFQEDGQFSAQRFDQVLRQMGYGRMQ
ncbi:MAG: SurA N-terminal domain-containing protein, partial [Thiopseudomonas sp.]